MDSLTQALLGATTFALVKDAEIGKKSLLIGAVAGTLPDLDVFLYPFYHEVEFLAVHRGVSHSIGLAVLLSLALGEMFHRFYKKQHNRTRWYLGFFLAIMTHSLLDVCTTFGTKLLSPFSNHIFSTNNIHVIEPTYTLILGFGVVALLIRNQSTHRRQQIIRMTLFISTLFILWTFVSKEVARDKFTKSLHTQRIEYEKIMVSPTPLNSLLWHGIVKTKEGYYFGTYSLLDRRENIKFYFTPSDNIVIQNIEKNKLVKIFLNYTQDFPLIIRDSLGNIQIFAIKYGPINYIGDPQFVYPLSLNETELTNDKIFIDSDMDHKGPILSFRNLFDRISGI